MNNPVLKEIIKYWWAPFSILSLTLMGIICVERQQLVNLQEKVLKKTFKAKLAIENSFESDSGAVTFKGAVREYSTYCYADKDRGFTLTFKGGLYFIGLIQNKIESSLPRSRKKFIVDEGLFRQEGSKIFLETRDSSGELKTIKVAEVIQATTKGNRIKHLSFYGEVLSHRHCAYYETALVEKYIK